MVAVDLMEANRLFSLNLYVSSGAGLFTIESTIFTSFMLFLIVLASYNLLPLSITFFAALSFFSMSYSLSFKPIFTDCLASISFWWVIATVLFIFLIGEMYSKHDADVFDGLVLILNKSNLRLLELSNGFLNLLCNCDRDRCVD